VLAADASNWLRPDAATSPDRLFCHVYGRAKGQAQMIPGWPYSVIAALEPGRTSWTAVLDAVRLGPDDDAAEVAASQIRNVVTRLIAAGHWREGDPAILVIVDAGYDVPRLAYQLSDLPVELLGRLRSDQVMHLPAPPRSPGTNSRPRKHGGAMFDRAALTNEHPVDSAAAMNNEARGCSGFLTGRARQRPSPWRPSSNLGNFGRAEYF
jgi:DDE superfamily endonuclease